MFSLRSREGFRLRLGSSLITIAFAFAILLQECLSNEFLQEWSFSNEHLKLRRLHPAGSSFAFQIASVAPAPSGHGSLSGRSKVMTK